jgi:hypothetical protein
VIDVDTDVDVGAFNKLLLLGIALAFCMTGLGTELLLLTAGSAGFMDTESVLGAFGVSFLRFGIGVPTDKGLMIGLFEIAGAGAGATILTRRTFLLGVAGKA